METPRGRTPSSTLIFAPEVASPFWYNWVHGIYSFVRRKPLGALGAMLVLALITTAVFAPLIAPYPYEQTSRDFLADPFTRDHILGTDLIGRDVFSRLVFGARVSVAVGFGAVVVSTALSLAMGILGGYFGGKFDLIQQRLVDAWMAMPTLIVLLTIVAIFGPDLVTVTLAIGISRAAGSSRIKRSAVIAIKEYPYFEAARVIGASDWRILRHYVLPNIMSVVLVTATIQLGAAILLEASLSFLGYGVPPPDPSWGGMLSGEARSHMLRQPLLSIWPGLALFLVVYGFNMLGDAIRDVLDPRLRGSR